MVSHDRGATLVSPQTPEIIGLSILLHSAQRADSELTDLGEAFLEALRSDESPCCRPDRRRGETTTGIDAARSARASAQQSGLGCI